MANPTIYPAPLRWGIIGCGDVTEVKSGPAYQQTEGFELAAVMRRDAEKLKDYANRHGVAKFTTDATALIQDENIDAIYIATPPDAHLEYALQVAATGKPCCIEKPLSPSYADSLAIREAFAKKGIPLFVAYYRRTLPRFERVREWLEADRIGEVRHLNWTLTQAPKDVDLTGANNWRTEKGVAPGGYFDDLASHGIDLFVHYLGNIAEVSGVSLNQQGLYTAKDAIAASWRHENGVTGAGCWNFGSYADEDRVEIFGSKGKIQFSVFANRPIVLETADGVEELSIDHPATVQLPHVRAMKRQLLDGDYVHPSTGESATHVSWVMDRMLAN